MMKQGKIWGHTTEFFRDKTISVHHLSIRRGGYCSKHFHKHKSNIFYILSGKLEISIWKENNIEDKTILIAEQTSVIPPGVYHRFQALQDTECMEIYTIELKEPDIEREDQGGIKA